MDETTTTDSPPPSAPAAGARAARASEMLTILLGHLGVTAKIAGRETADEVVLRVQVESGGDAVGLGESGAPLWEPIGYLIGKMINRDPAQRTWVSLELGAPGAAGVPVEERDEELVQLGRALAERAKQLGKVLALGPMGARERRMIHMAVKEVTGVSSRSEGDGAARRLLIVPERLSPPPGEAA